VRNYLGDEFEWDLNLVLVANEVPVLELGVAGELGWTTWLGRRRSPADAADDRGTRNPSIPNCFWPSRASPRGG
jgi:type VI secretion system protein ImpH